jgi:hypothetical protein
MFKKISEFKFLIAILILSIFIRSFFLHPIYSDENIYFNAGRYILEGKIPYKDYFFSHPPVQIYVYGFLFKIFGANFLVGKIFYLLLSTSCALLIFLIVKEVYDRKVALISSIIFLLTPSFIIFSLMGNGMWEAMILVLISFFLILKNKLPLASLIYSIALFDRYLSLVYLPFFIFYIYLKGKKISNFLVPLVAFFSTFFIFLSFVFGFDYINQTILFHYYKPKGMTDFAQYLSIGLFTCFLSIIAIFLGYIEKDKTLIFFAATPLLADIIILLFARPIFYHYFLISVPFYCISTGKILIKSRYTVAKIIIVSILFLSIFSNFQTIDFYLNPIHSKKFYYVSELIQKNVLKDETIFGEPVITNFVSFKTKTKIFENYLDSYLQRISFEGEGDTLKKLEKKPPKIFIDMIIGNTSYYLSDPNFRQFISNYIIIGKTDGIPVYNIYVHR